MGGNQVFTVTDFNFSQRMAHVFIEFCHAFILGIGYAHRQ